MKEFDERIAAAIREQAASAEQPEPQPDVAAFVRFKTAMGKRAVARARQWRLRGRMDLAAEALAGSAMCRWTIKDARQ